VGLDSANGHEEICGDLAVRFARGHKPEDLVLAPAQAFG
jgi:hypothetical protein